MKKILVLLVLLLTGCGTVNTMVDAYLMKYDPVEYKLIVDIRTIAMLAKDKCDDVESSKKTALRLSHLSIELMNFSEYQPHNKPVKESSVDEVKKILRENGLGDFEKPIGMFGLRGEKLVQVKN